MQSYENMSLALELREALQKLNFIKPTPIQAAVIPLATEGSDIMACAETGSGKTAAYGIPIVSRLIDNPNINSLILAPTRELAHQIADFLRQLTENVPNFKVTALVGGADMHKQLNALKRKPRIVVATPGRLIDHLRRRSLQLLTTEVLVLDEGDRMLDMGFAPQLNQVLKFLPQKRQTLLFTATLPEKVRKLAEDYLHNPQQINVGRVSQPVAKIKQSVIQVTFKEKDDRIVDELNKRQGSVIVFARTKRRTDILAKILMEYGFEVDLIHGGRTQGQRNRAIQNFKEGRSRILCATDIAARGIDVPQVQHVINFDLPMLEEDYVHRIGRTARNGASGEAVSFVMPEEHRAWMSLVRKYKIQGVELRAEKKISGSRDTRKVSVQHEDRNKPEKKRTGKFRKHKPPSRNSRSSPRQRP